MRFPAVRFTPMPWQCWSVGYLTRACAIAWAVVAKDSLSIDQYVNRYGATGYVVDVVPLAVLAAVNSTNLLETIGQLVRCGGDTDTIAAMFGQIFGAACGAQALPSAIIDRIDAVHLLRKTADRLSQLPERNADG